MDSQLDKFIKDALAEDVGNGDHTSLACIDPDQKHKARLLVKDSGIIAGVELAQKVFSYLDADSEFELLKKDGDPIFPGDVAYYVQANTRALLKGERLILNCMQRMSGIATLSRRYADEVSGLSTKVLDTRKTTPLIRFLEKWAVKIGGCENYRFGLYDWIMIKDNHVDACGGMQNAVEKVTNYLAEKDLKLGITVEVRNLVELHELLAVGGITRIMFDNFEIPILWEGVASVNKAFETEASGGINLSNVRKYAETGVDFVSVGSLTHSPQSLDLSLKVVK